MSAAIGLVYLRVRLRSIEAGIPQPADTCAYGYIVHVKSKLQLCDTSHAACRCLCLLQPLPKLHRPAHISDIHACCRQQWHELGQWLDGRRFSQQQLCCYDGVNCFI